MPRPPTEIRLDARSANDERGRVRAVRMARSLCALLDRVSGARGVLPYLAALESALQQHGLAPLETMSTQTLSRVCAQLASLTVADDDLPLQDLQSLLLRALKRRSAPPGDGAAPQSTTSQSFDGGAVMVTEISHSAFMAATAGHADTVPMALTIAPDPAAQPR